jgi:hypothetical protein
MDAVLHGTQYRKDLELCRGIGVIIGSEGGWQGNQIYQLPKKTILNKFEIQVTARCLKTTYSTASLCTTGFAIQQKAVLVVSFLQFFRNAKPVNPKFRNI